MPRYIRVPVPVRPPAYYPRYPGGRVVIRRGPPVSPGTAALVGGAVGGVVIGSALGRPGAGLSIALGGITATLAGATMVYRSATIGSLATLGFGVGLALTGIANLNS